MSGRNRIEIEEFLWAYFEAAEKKLSRQELADQLGVTPDTIYTRVHELRKRGHRIPHLPGRRRVTLDERVTKTLKEIRKTIRV